MPAAKEEMAALAAALAVQVVAVAKLHYLGRAMSGSSARSLGDLRRHSHRRMIHTER